MSGPNNFARGCLKARTSESEAIGIDLPYTVLNTFAENLTLDRIRVSTSPLDVWLIDWCARCALYAYDHMGTKWGLLQPAQKLWIKNGQNGTSCFERPFLYWCALIKTSPTGGSWLFELQIFSFWKIWKPKHPQLNQNSNKVHRLGKLKSCIFLFQDPTTICQTEKFIKKGFTWPGIYKKKVLLDQKKKKIQEFLANPPSDKFFRLPLVTISKLNLIIIVLKFKI